MGKAILGKVSAASASSALSDKAAHVAKHLGPYVGVTVPGERGFEPYSVPADSMYLEHYYTEHGARHVHFMHLEKFAETFGDAIDPNKPLRHADIIATDPNDEKGHHKYLDKWHAEGLI